MNESATSAAGDAVTTQFLHLIDSTVWEVERVRAEIASSGQYPGELSSADLTISNLAILKRLVLTDKLPRPSRGQVSNRASLNISRQMGDWTDDDKLREASYAVEDYYRQSM